MTTIVLSWLAAQLQTAKAEDMRQFPDGWSCQGAGCDAKLPHVGPCDGGLNKYCFRCACKMMLTARERISDAPLISSLRAPRIYHLFA
jgi:hypothetical protein